MEENVQFHINEDINVCQSSLRDLPFVQNLYFFDGGRKACLTLQEPGQSRHFIILNSYEANQNFKLDSIFEDFLHSGVLGNRHPAGGPSRYFLSNLVS